MRGIGLSTVDLPQDITGDRSAAAAVDDGTLVWDRERIHDASYTAKVVVITVNEKSSSSWALECCLRDFLDPLQDVVVLVHVQPCREQISTSMMGTPIYRSRLSVTSSSVDMLHYYARIVHHFGAVPIARIKLKVILSDMHPGDAVVQWLSNETAESIIFGEDFLPSESSRKASLSSASSSDEHHSSSAASFHRSIGARDLASLQEEEDDDEKVLEMAQLFRRGHQQEEDVKSGADDDDDDDDDIGMINRVVVVVGKSMRKNALLSILFPFFEADIDQQYDVIRGGVGRNGRAVQVNRTGWTHMADIVASGCPFTCWVIHEQSDADDFILKVSRFSRQVCFSMF
eukprot:TRINITY_DN14820_c0_g1_i3.p1 TRINITY_DN14820_c0_g1~~TRINITY_DN14820_c0_g1_i3.p1  ORF type:complete len:344 (-),score=95.11 TRINITY_DN14820_c0_g1_i3:28-1059(-)